MHTFSQADGVPFFGGTFSTPKKRLMVHNNFPPG